MYRDEEEALRHRLEALEVELKNEQRGREAAEARAREAEARALEQSIKQEPAEAMAARRRRAMIIILGVAAAVVGLVFSGMLFSPGPVPPPREDNSARVAAQLMANEKRLQVEVQRQKMLLEEQGLRLRRSEERLKTELSSDTVDPITGRVESKKPPRAYTRQTWKTLGESRQAYQDGDHARARELARAILKQVPADARANMLLGASSCQLGDKTTARSVFLKLDTHDQVALLGICRGVRVDLSDFSR